MSEELKSSGEERNTDFFSFFSLGSCWLSGSAKAIVKGRRFIDLPLGARAWWALCKALEEQGLGNITLSGGNCFAFVFVLV